MKCIACGSEKVDQFEGEIAIHFPGRRNIDKPAIFVSPTVFICIECGLAQFAVPGAELRLLK